MKQWLDKLHELALETLSEGSKDLGEKMLAIADGISVERNSKSIYLSIIHKLASEYFRIFYVDIRDDTYLEYDSQDPSGNFDTQDVKADFFLTNSDFKDHFPTLHHEDEPLFLAAFKKENFVHAIQNHGEFSVIYRVAHKDGYFFVNMKGSQLDDDPYHIIVAVKNIDADVKREQDYLLSLTRAKEEANRDGLTGIRNRHAYLEYIEDLARQLDSGEVTCYGIAVFDINGLKKINDTLGHQAGDNFIKEGCGIICDIFKHSPVFRIGGDEFVAVLKGEDYNNLDGLLRQLEDRNEQSAACGGIVIAAGAARYAGEKEIKRVFERADEDMYFNKKRLKAVETASHK